VTVLAQTFARNVTCQIARALSTGTFDGHLGVNSRSGVESSESGLAQLVRNCI
jgi:hypothetical protein